MKNITRRNLLPTTCQSRGNTWNVSSGHVKRAGIKRGKRNYTGETKKLRKCNHRDTRHTSYLSSCRESERSDWFDSCSSSTYRHYVALHFGIAIFRLASVRFCSVEFQKRHFVRDPAINSVHSSSRAHRPASRDFIRPLSHNDDEELRDRGYGCGVLL